MAPETKKPSKSAVGNGFDPASRVEPDLRRGSLISPPLPDLWPDKVEDVLEQSIERIVGAGFPDARISMVITERDETWLLPKVGSGVWRMHSLNPHEKLDRETVLASVAREKHTWLTCEVAGDTASGGGADRYAIPLLDDTKETIAIAEVRVGSASRNFEEKQERIEQLAATIALAMTRAIQTEELKVARDLDNTLLQCLGRQTVQRAAHHFAVRSAKIMDTHSIVIRLIEKGRKTLRLISGYGDVFDAASEEDLIKPLADESPTAKAVRMREPVVINDVNEDEEFCRLRERHTGSRLGKSFSSISSVASFPIRAGKRIYGVVSVYSRQPCYFTRSRTRSIEDVSRRLAILLSHLQKKEDEQRYIAELDVLREVKPPLEGQSNLYKALGKQVDKIRDVLNADIVSCFLFDSDRNRFVLRAQAGWQDGRWVDAAWYGPHEGVVGHAAKHRKPQHVPDVLALREKLKLAKGKYDRMMFGRDLTAPDSCELIYLPLYFNEELLGVVAIYRLQTPPAYGRKTGFRTTLPRVLKEAASTLSAFTTALQEHDSDRWARQELLKRQAVMQTLLKAEKTNLQVLLAGFVRAVINHYHFHHAAVYLCRKGDNPSLVSHAGRNESSPLPEKINAETAERIRQAIETGKPQAVRVPLSDDPLNPQRIKGEDTVREIFIPFKVNDDRDGVLCFNWRGLREPDDPHLLPRHDEHGLVKLAQNLERAVRAHLLTEARENAMRAVDGMSFLLRQNFHRLANSVAEIQACVEVLGRREPTSEQFEILEIAKMAVQQQSEVFESVRASSGQLANLKRSQHSIDTLLSEALSKYSRTIEEKRLNLDTADIEEVSAYVDPMQILECFQNLIANAVEALPPGGDLQLSLCTDADRNLWEFIARDNGPGIPPLDLVRYRKGEQPEMRDPRKGLGLFIAGLYCESHGGKLDIESELEKGTTVCIRIPINDIN